MYVYGNDERKVKFVESCKKKMRWVVWALVEALGDGELLKLQETGEVRVSTTYITTTEWDIVCAQR